MRALTAPQALPAPLAQQVQEYLVQRVPLVQGPVVQRVQRVLVLRELLGPQGLVLMEQQVLQVLA